MNDVGLGELLLRMLISLAVVLAVVLAAYVIIRRRQGVGAGTPRSGRRGTAAGLLVRSRGTTTSPAARRAGLRVVGRVGVGRTSSVVAVQFADRVFMIGASEQAAPAVLAELELEEWQRATQQPEELTPVSRRSAGTGESDGPRTGEARPGFLDALREATTRRG